MVQVGPRATATQPTHAPPAPPEPRYTDEVPTPRFKRYSVEIPIDPEYLPYLGLMALALGLRLWDLGARALHHDESLHAFYAWRLFRGEGYVHDPMMHGPLLFLGNALTYLLLGASDFTARLVPALLGVTMVGLPFLLRHELGRHGAVAAAALFAISPTYLYFSRFIRHDIYVDVFTLLLVTGVFRYLATGLRHWFYITVVAAALLFATKEDFYISGFIPFTFLAAAWFLLKGERRQLYRARVRALDWRTWALGAGLFLVINFVLYTTLLTNLRGVCTALVTLPLDGCAGAKGALSYWLEQQDFARGGQPWFYYMMLLPLYELLPLLLAGAALFLVRGKNLFFWFSVYWFAAALAIYSWAGEKMPWMLPQMVLPLILLAARLLGEWSEAGWGRRALAPRGLAVGGLMLLASLALLAWLGLGAVAIASPLVQQGATLQRLALSVLVAGIAGALFYLTPRWGRETVLPGVALGLLAIFGAGYIRTGLMVTYEHPDTPNEPLIYVQSSPDVTFIAHEIERISQQTGQGTDMRLLLDNGFGDGDHEAVSWPFEWYLRDYQNRRYYTRTIDPSINLSDYPVLLARATNVDPIQKELNQYVGQKYRLNWWFPEDYKNYAAEGPGFFVGSKRVGLPSLRLDLIAQSLASPENRVKLLKFLVYREAPGELGAREMYFYVHRQVPAVGPAPVGGGRVEPMLPAPPSVANQRLESAIAQPQADGSVVFGRSADSQPVLIDPKNVAVGTDGRFYVVEGRAARVTVFNADGSIANAWGSPGSGDGQFTEPWGVAVAPDGDVYVADTWNHRVQRFDANGTFLGKWGTLGDAKGRTDADAGKFWGPRQIAVAGNGEVYVTDTGNKRVQVFTPAGEFVRMFGGEGDQPGQLREPVGVAIDAQGDVWVADAWNRRVQKLSPAGQPLAAFPIVGGWESTSVSNKPYIAVDGQGRVVASFPDQGRVTIYSPQGEIVKEVQLPSNGSAVGVATAPDGRIFVADARNNVIDAYPAL